MNNDASFFDSIAGTWDSTRNPNPKILQLLLDKANLAPMGNILDVGCGTGVLIPYLQSIATQDEEDLEAAGKITAIDSSSRMLHIAKEKYSHWANIKFVAEDVMSASLPESYFESITCLNVFPHLKDCHHEFLNRCRSLLTPGGKIVIMHDISRRAVNGVHASSDQVADHLLPPVSVTGDMIKAAGLQVCMAKETAEYYIAVGRRIY